MESNKLYKYYDKKNQKELFGFYNLEELKFDMSTIPTIWYLDNYEIIECEVKEIKTISVEEFKKINNN